MAFQATLRHVLVNQEPLIAVSAEPNEVDEVGMPKNDQHEDLHYELLAPLEALPVELLNGDYLFIRRTQGKSKPGNRCYDGKTKNKQGSGLESGKTKRRKKSQKDLPGPTPSDP